MRRRELVRGAGRARRHGDALRVQEEQQRLALHVFESEVEASGKPPLQAAVDPGLPDPLQHFSSQPVRERGESLAVLCHPLTAQLRRPAQAHDARDVLRPGAQPPLVPSSLGNGRDLAALSDVEGSHALGAVELVSGDGEQVDPQGAHVHGDLAHALHGIGVQVDVFVCGDFADILYGLNGTDLVVGVHH